MLIRLGVLSLIGLLAIGIPAAMASSVKEPSYTVVSESDGVELRDYAPLIRAEPLVRGPYRDSVSDGFRVLAAYIFGGNTGSVEIAMAAPVGAEPAGTKIAMTAPVGAEATELGWLVSFVMPAEYTMATLPRPLDSRVSLREVSAHRVAALRFSGWAGEDTVAEKTTRLAAAMQKQGLVALGEPVVAQYNPPWTPPFLRRNEILVTVSGPS